MIDGVMVQASFLPGVLSWNWPRATWTKRTLSPFFWMSRRMALQSADVRPASSHLASMRLWPDGHRMVLHLLRIGLTATMLQ